MNVSGAGRRFRFIVASLFMKNILILLTDQQRKDSLGCYGNPVCQTANLDALAAESVRCERNYVANPICMPSRHSLFSGKHPHNHGMWTNGLCIPEYRNLPTHLAGNGYQTASVGKIHFEPYLTDESREGMAVWREGKMPPGWNGPYWGFQHVELALWHTAVEAHYGEWFHANGGTGAMIENMPDGSRPIPERLHDSTFVADRSIDYLRRRDPSKPFFLVASFPDPHHPFDPPGETLSKYPPETVDPPIGGPEDLATRPEHYLRHFRGEWTRGGLREAAHPEGIDDATTRLRRSATHAMNDLIDRQAGRILNELDDLGLRDDTVVVFTSDHGELLGDHGLWLKGPFFYEGLINTPLLVRSPGLAPAVCRELFSDVDLAPTLCELAGAPALPEVDGVSQAATLAGGPAARDACMIEYRNGFGPVDIASRTIVTQTAKYVRYQDGTEELTDLECDPEERHNVVMKDDCSAARDRLRLRLLDEILQTERRDPRQLCHA